MTREINSLARQQIVEAKTIYAHPSILKLSGAIWETQKGSAASFTTLLSVQRQGAEIDSLLSRSICDLPLHPRLSLSSISPKMITVVLTGSTGGLGTYLLATLLESKNVAHVYCLNRSANISARQKDLLSIQGLPSTLPASRVTFLHSSLAHEDLGLCYEDYSKLLSHTTHIIHAAWPVNFAQPLSYFENNHPRRTKSCHLVPTRYTSS